jgi:hypothetical protein
VTDFLFLTLAERARVDAIVERALQQAGIGPFDTLSGKCAAFMEISAMYLDQASSPMSMSTGHAEKERATRLKLMREGEEP